MHLLAGVAVAVRDCQHTVSNIEAAPNRAALGGLWDAAFGGAAERVRVGPKVGRRLADYPEGWEEVHAAWRAGDMTARAAMGLLGQARDLLPPCR